MKNSKVLVLDDEQIVCERLEEHLTKLGFTVITFTDSQKALNHLSNNTFDVVVTDLKMSGPTGLDVLHYVHENSPGTQVIIITGYASMDAVREAEYTGVFEFITKPFNLPKIGALVKKASDKALRHTGKAEK